MNISLKRLSMLAGMVSITLSAPLLGASIPTSQSPSEQPVVEDKNGLSADLPPVNQPPIKTSAKDEKKKTPKEGVKQSHSEPANGKIPPKPKDSMRKHKNPIDMSSGKELLPMPVEPKR